MMDLTTFKFSLSNPSEIEDTKRRTLTLLQRRDLRPQQSKTEHVEISEELRSYLLLIQRTPGMGSTQRDKAHGVSGAKGSRLRKKLRELDLITERKVKQGRGRPISHIRLTERAERHLKPN